MVLVLERVGNQSVGLVWGIFVFITFSAQLHADLVWDIPYSCGPDAFVEPSVDAHIRSSHLLHGTFPDFFECPRGTLLETCSMDALVNIDSVFSGHHLVDGGCFFSPPFFAGAILQGWVWNDKIHFLTF